MRRAGELTRSPWLFLGLLYLRPLWGSICHPRPAPLRHFGHPVANGPIWALRPSGSSSPKATMIQDVVASFVGMAFCVGTFFPLIPNKQDTSVPQPPLDG